MTKKRTKPKPRLFWMVVGGDADYVLFRSKLEADNYANWPNAPRLRVRRVRVEVVGEKEGS